MKISIGITKVHCSWYKVTDSQSEEFNWRTHISKVSLERANVDNIFKKENERGKTE